MKKITVTVIALCLALATPVMASTRLQKLADNRYVITHQKQTGFAGQGKALRTAHEKAAALCLLLDYNWYEVMDKQSQGRGYQQTAAATMEVKFYKTEDKEDLINCQGVATEEQKLKMQEALTKMNER